MQDIFLSRLWVDDHERASADFACRVDRLSGSFQSALPIRKRIAALAASIILSAASISTAVGPIDFGAGQTEPVRTEYRTPVSI